VPKLLKPVEEENVPAWLWRRTADEPALAELPPKERAGSEMSATQVFDRLAGTWTYWGWKGKYFDGEADANAFYDELRYMLCRQMVAPKLCRNGSTPDCIGPMASTARPPGSLLRSIRRPASSLRSNSAL